MNRFPLAPRAKTNLQTAMMSFIFDPFMKYWNRKVDKIIEKHVMLCASTQQGFNYKGEDFTGSAKRLLHPPIQRLHKSLAIDMDALLRERETVSLYEEPLVKSVLCALMNLSNNPWDYFQLLPEELHPVWERYKTQLPTGYESEITEAIVSAFQTKYEAAFDVIRIRMVTNLIL